MKICKTCKQELRTWETAEDKVVMCINPQCSLKGHVFKTPKMIISRKKLREQLTEQIFGISPAQTWIEEILEKVKEKWEK